jgi:hypothetical protein
MLHHINKATQRGRACLPFVLLLCFPWADSARTLAQDQSRSSRRNLAEIHFGDGSIVRMTVVQEHLEVETKYGALTVPVSDVRRVEFGMHVPSDVQQRVRQSIKKLGSEVYKERDAASRALVQAGHFAYPLVRKASRSPDQEVSARAMSVLRQISERASPELLRLPEDDVIHTTSGFTVIGRITTDNVKAHWPHVGDLSLKVSELRSMRLFQNAGKHEVIVDASKYGGTFAQWFDTGIHVEAGQRVAFSSEGQVDLWPQGPGQYVTGPKGYHTTGKDGQFLAGALIARLGASGKAFSVGETYEGTMSEEGKLYLLIVPSPWNSSAAGQYRVCIQASLAPR